MINRLFNYVVLYILWILRKFISLDGRAYLILFAAPLQPFLASIGRMRAFAVYQKAKRTCPAYREFLKAHDYKEPHRRWTLESVPVMTKENYVKKYGIEARCYGGKIPAPGTVIDESSGSSGVPNNWVRSATERNDVKRILQLNYQIIYNDDDCILLNCFALGPWATGMNVSMSLVDVGILKSIGPDAKKLENTLTLFGANYRYLIFGYPPFIKAWVDNTTLDLNEYKTDLIVGGEGMSEALRTYFYNYFQTVISSYGASDLEINIGVETELTVALRRRCLEDRKLSETLFGRETPPMIFQYNAVDYIIETTEDGELLFTIGRQASAAPKIRYNLKDLGGTYTHKDLATKLSGRGINIKDLATRQSCFPILFVHGRGDLSVPFYGAKVFPADIEEIINTHPTLVKKLNSFQLVVDEDEKMNRILKIHLETVKEYGSELPDNENLCNLFFEELCRVNQDFREVSKMFSRDCVVVIIHEFETGPFADRDIRIKNKYIG